MTPQPRRERVAVLGAGSWGTALAVHLGRIGHDVRLWARDAALVDEIAQTRAQRPYLPDVASRDASSRPRSRCGARRRAAFVVARRAVAWPAGRDARCRRRSSTAGAVSSARPKGSRRGSLARMSQVLAEETGGRMPVVVLSGRASRWKLRAACRPRSSRRPTTRAAASACRNTSADRRFRLYASDDVTGVEIGGALKNVIAIAAGVVEGTGLGHNAMAALITRGLARSRGWRARKAAGATRSRA